METSYGPQLPISKQIHELKYRQRGESFYDAAVRIASALSDSEEHRLALKQAILNQRLLFAGRVQSSVGAARRVASHNCFVMHTIPDSMVGIFDILAKSARTMQMGGGIGMDFSTLRPKNWMISSLDTFSSGPISFMDVWDAMCKTIMSAGHRRGAMMGVLRVDHPDIRDFIYAKHDGTRFNNFNISVGITDEFMQAVVAGKSFDLKFRDTVCKTVDARNLWDEIMRSTWDYADPGVLFLDNINNMNNLWYCENIAATNPCGEQPLPPNGACLLGSLNLVKYLVETDGSYQFDMNLFRDDIKIFVRALDNVIDIAHYPLPEQEIEAGNKRRMGIGITGLANALEAMGHPYGSLSFLHYMEDIMRTLRDTSYETSISISEEKGSFPLLNTEKYLEGKFISTLPGHIREGIWNHGIRNSHLLSVAPTGTISLTADNVSSGIEPVWAYGIDRVVNNGIKQTVETIPDYGYSVLNTEGKLAADVRLAEHLAVVATAQKYVDSSVSKTINVPETCDWKEFKNVYFEAWRNGLKGCTTFREGGKKEGIFKKSEEGGACFIDPLTGAKSCAE